MSDRDAIVELINRYALNVDTRNMSGCANLFSADGHVSVVGKKVTNGRIDMNGQAAILTWLERLVAGGGTVGKHYVSNSCIDFEGDTAKSTSDGMFLLPDAEGEWKIFEVTRYFDAFAKIDGVWKFTDREINIPS